MNKTSAVLAVAAVAVVAAAAIAGVWLADWRGSPSDSEILDGAMALVPAGADITDEAAGPQGAFPDDGRYRAFVEYRSTGGRTDRAAAVRAHAEAQGWTVTGTGDLAGATVFEVERDTVTARISVLDNDHTRISAGAGDVSTITRIGYAAVTLVVGAAAVAAAWLANRRASHTHRNSNAPAHVQ